ncbi:MAG: PD40 domain-containing protein [Anaerolineae bacterium]|nr:PD40 domain-containing protein [Anaerolineae bacterium]
MTENIQSAPEINPYIAGNPVSGEAMFYGREDVFEFVRANLIGRHQDNILVLHGQRRTGKTSVLYQMHRHIDSTYIPILVDIQGMALEGMSGFLWELAYTIQRALRRPHGISLPRPNRQDFQADARNEFQNVFLPQVQTAIGNERRLLLMFDESVLLYDKVRLGALETDVFRYLSSLIQHHAFLAFLFTIGEKLEQIQAEFATLFRVALYKEISFLDHRAAAALITEPVREHYGYLPAAIERIVRITSGHPYFTQLICHAIFNRWQQQQFLLAADGDVEAILPQVIEAGSANLQYTWDDSTPAEKVVLSTLKDLIDEEGGSAPQDTLEQRLAEYEIHMPAGELAHALQDLNLRDVINNSSPYRFRVDLMRRWLKQHAPIVWVKEQVGEAVREWQQTVAAPIQRRGRWAGMAIVVVILLIAALSGLWILNRPISEQEALTRTVEVQALATRRAAAEALAQMEQDPALRVTATAQQAHLEAIAATQTAQSRAALTTQAAAQTATVEAAQRATLAAIQTMTAQPTPTPTPTTTNTPSPTPLPTATPTSTATAVSTPTPQETSTAVVAPTPTTAPTQAQAATSGGRIVFVQRNEIFTCAPDGSDVKRLTFNGAVESDPAWSPNGQRIAYVSNATGNNEIWVMNADGSGAGAITSHAANDLYPDWSPDGSRIVFISERDNTREVYVVAASGGTPTRLTNNNIDEAYPAWSPNGQQIAFAGVQLGQGGLWTISADGSNGANPTKISAVSGTFADVEWFGTRIYFAAAGTPYGSDYNIYSVLVDGGGWTGHSTGAGDDRSPSHAPGGGQWAFSNSGNLYVLTAIGPVKLFDAAAEPDWSLR